MILRLFKERILSSYKKYGLMHIYRVFLCILMQPVLKYVHYEIFEIDLRRQSEDISINIGDLNFKVISNLEDLKNRLHGKIKGINPLNIAEKSFKDGYVCGVTENKNGEQLFNLWFTTGTKIIIQEGNFFINEKEAYFKEAYTIPSKRGQNVYPRSLLLLSNYLREKKIEKLYCLILPCVKASIKGVRKIGAKITGRIRYFKLLNSNNLILKF